MAAGRKGEGRSVGTGAVAPRRRVRVGQKPTDGKARPRAVQTDFLAQFDQAEATYFRRA